MGTRGPVGPAKVGRRVALANIDERFEAGADQVYVVTGKPLRFEGNELPAGVEVPGAARWPRLEAWVGARRVRPLRVNEDYTPYAEFVEAVRAAVEEGEAPAETESETVSQE